jgi:hypothetical protein
LHHPGKSCHPPHWHAAHCLCRSLYTDPSPDLCVNWGYPSVYNCTPSDGGGPRMCMLYEAQTFPEHVVFMNMATSEDGVHWTPFNTTTVIPGLPGRRCVQSCRSCCAVRSCAMCACTCACLSPCTYRPDGHMHPVKPVSTRDEFFHSSLSTNPFAIDDSVLTVQQPSFAHV